MLVTGGVIWAVDSGVVMDTVLRRVTAVRR